MWQTKVERHRGQSASQDTPEEGPDKFRTSSDETVPGSGRSYGGDIDPYRKLAAIRMFVSPEECHECEDGGCGDSFINGFGPLANAEQPTDDPAGFSFGKVIIFMVVVFISVVFYLVRHRSFHLHDFRFL